jgi:hypothetical protein
VWTVRHLATDIFGQDNWDMNDMTNYSFNRQNGGNNYGRKGNFDDPWNSYQTDGGLSVFFSYSKILFDY